MQDFSCTKCGSINVFIDDRGSQKALMCKDCGSWLKWIGKKELPSAIHFIRECIQDDDKKVHVVGESQTNKQKLIDYIDSLPDDLQWLKTPEGQHDDLDIKIFIKPKDDEFIKWYFGM